MVLLNIFFELDGSVAWVNIAVLILAVVAGYLLHRAIGKSRLNNKYAAIIASWEAKYKSLDHDFKNFKAGVQSSEKTAQKLAADSTGRVKALEGDIRALSEEKNRYHNQVSSKDGELKVSAEKIGALEDRIKELGDEKQRLEASMSSKLKAAQQDLLKAQAWEGRVKTAELEAQRAKAALSHAERKQLEAELRLRSTVEFAGKVGPLEAELVKERQQTEFLSEELKAKTALIDELHGKVQHAELSIKELEQEQEALGKVMLEKERQIDELVEKERLAGQEASPLSAVRAALEVETSKNSLLRNELENKLAIEAGHMAEIEHLKGVIKKLSAERISLQQEIQLPAPVAEPLSTK